MRILPHSFEVFIRNNFIYRKNDVGAEQIKTDYTSAWNEWKKIVSESLSMSGGQDLLVENTENWQNSGNLSRRFWTRIKYKQLFVKPSCIAAMISKDNLRVYLEWHGYKNEHLNDERKVHNSWVSNIADWIGEKHINPKDYRVWINQDIDENFEEYITLNEFINNKPIAEKLLVRLTEDCNNWIRVGRVFPKSIVLNHENITKEMGETISELEWIYIKAVGIDKSREPSEVIYQTTPNHAVVKESYSWSKVNKENFIARKKVDWSIFHDGSTIPIPFHEDFEWANQHQHLKRGEKHQVTLRVNEQMFDAQLVNVDRVNVKSDTIQLIYGKNIADLFKSVFRSSYEYIRDQRKHNSNKTIIVSDERAEYIEFYKTDKAFIYELKFNTYGKSEVKMVPFSDLTPSELVNHVYQYIKSKGFYYKKEEIINLYLSLKTKPFVILSGISGTGKTKMVQWFAESLGATEENGQFHLIPIRPDWNDGSDLLGYKDIKGDFVEGPLTRIIKQANESLQLPYFVLLDEMNLARVEYYFSDILSVMESRKWKDGQMVTSHLLSKEMTGYDFDLRIPSNLYIVGTVNMDETTHPFSKKVLDRANTIEFNRVELSNISFLNETEEVAAIPVWNEKLASKYLHLKDVYNDHQELVMKTTDELEKINKSLQIMNAHVGYRVRDEICFYLAYNEEDKLMKENEAFDHCILQKILPRITGSDSRVERLLMELYRLFTNKEFVDDMDNYESDFKTAKYPNSARKVVEMLRRLKDDGFTSFWIS